MRCVFDPIVILSHIENLIEMMMQKKMPPRVCVGLAKNKERRETSGRQTFPLPVEFKEKNIKNIYI